MNKHTITEILDFNKPDQVFEIIFIDGMKKRGILSHPESEEDKNGNRWWLEIHFPVTMRQGRMIEGKYIKSINISKAEIMNRNELGWIASCGLRHN